jgi:hypothetical protein
VATPVAVGDGWLYFAMAAGLGGLNALNTIVASLQGRVSLFELVRRMKVLVYVALSAGVSLAVLAGLRFVDLPDTRITGLSQVVLAAVGSGVAVGAGRVLREAPSEAPPSPRAPGVRQVRALFDQLLDALSRDVKSDIERAEVDLVAQHQFIEYTKARKSWSVHLMHLYVAGPDSERKKLNDDLARLDHTHAFEDEDAARDDLIYAVIDRGGEKLLSKLVKLYRARYPDAVPTPAGPTAATTTVEKHIWNRHR